MVRGVTLDLWDTVIADDSDEQERRARGMASKWDTRMDVVASALAAAISVDPLGFAAAEILCAAAASKS